MTHDKKHMIEVICPFCGQTTSVHFDDDDWEKYQKYFVGMSRMERPNIQSIFPDMPAKTRELLISGTCKKCQKEIFGA